MLGKFAEAQKSLEFVVYDSQQVIFNVFISSRKQN